MRLLDMLKRWIWGAPVIEVPIPIPLPRKKEPEVPKVKIAKEPKGSCAITGKLCRSEHGAKGRAKRDSAPRLRAYKCQFCDWWHLTHKKDTLRR